MAATSAAPKGKLAKAKPVAPTHRRAAVASLLTGSHTPAPLLLMPPVAERGADASALGVARHALRQAVAGSQLCMGEGSLGGLVFTRATPPAPAPADQLPPPPPESDVLTAGAGALHCAAFRAAWAACQGWDASSEHDPSAEVFFPSGFAPGGAIEPLMLLPPHPRGADQAALQVRACARRVRAGRRA